MERCCTGECWGEGRTIWDSVSVWGDGDVGEVSGGELNLLKNWLVSSIQAPRCLPVFPLHPCDVLHYRPHIPHTVLLEFGLQLSPVVVFARPQHLSEFVLHSLLLSVS